MSKLAIKTKKKILENNVFLKRSYDGYLQYGLMELISTKGSKDNAIGNIKDNLLQEDIIISYDDEIEKLRILECIPINFYYKVNMESQKIYISFKKEAIKAHLFINREYVSQIYRFLTCFDEEEDITLRVTLKSKELTDKILEMQKKILEVKKEFFPQKYLTNEQAAKDVKSFLIWLLENYKAEIMEEANLTEYMINLRKYYDNSDIEMYKNCLKEKVEGYQFSIKYNEQIFKITIGSRKTGDYFEDYGGLEEELTKFANNLKKQK